MGFCVDWNVTDRNTGAIMAKVLPDTYWCRDSAYYSMTRVVHDKFRHACGVSDINMYGSTADKLYYAWRHWVLEYAAEALDCSVSFAMMPEHDDGNRAHYVGKYVDRQISEVIPRTIELLAPLYPTVTFTPFTRMQDFGEDILHGIQLRGDLAVIPAFYWSGYYQRQLATKVIIPEVFSPDSYSIDHINAWERVLNGQELHGKYMLALQGGPIVSHNAYISNLVPDRYKSDSWFNIKAIF